MRVQLSALLVVALSSAAHADDKSEQEQRDDDNFIPLGIAPELGAGVAVNHGNKVGFDGTLRWGLTGRLADWFRPGAFVDVHTVNFDTMDAAIGPQVQTRLSGDNALATRVGVGVDTNGTKFVLGGLQYGNALLNVGVTGRAYDDGHSEIAATLNVTSAFLLLPFVGFPGIGDL